MPQSTALGLLLIRLSVGLIVAMHGLPKLMNFTEWSAKQPSMVLAVCAVLGEFAGGLGLASGFLTRIAAAGVTSVMWFIAFKVQGAHQKLAEIGTGAGTKFEYPFILGMVAFAFVLMGAGSYSLDEKVFGVKKKRRIF